MSDKDRSFQPEGTKNDDKTDWDTSHPETSIQGDFGHHDVGVFNDVPGGSIEPSKPVGSGKRQSY